MEEAIGVTYDSRGQLIGKRAVVRYADDFVCFSETREDAEQVQKILVEWLAERGLTLSEEKTRIVHLTEGFDFLGFSVRHYPAPQTSRTGWKLLIKREQRISSGRAEEAERPVEQSARYQRPIRSCKA
jgi:RNA-directed DNA polymerase